MRNGGWSRTTSASHAFSRAQNPIRWARNLPHGLLALSLGLRHQAGAMAAEAFVLFSAVNCLTAGHRKADQVPLHEEAHALAIDIDKWKDLPVAYVRPAEPAGITPLGRRSSVSHWPLKWMTANWEETRPLTSVKGASRNVAPRTA